MKICWAAVKKKLYQVAKIINPKIEPDCKIFCQTFAENTQGALPGTVPSQDQDLFPECQKDFFFKSEHEIGILSLAY